MALNDLCCFGLLNFEIEMPMYICEGRSTERLNVSDFDKFMKMEFSGDKFIAHCNEGEKILLKDAIVPGHDSLVLIGPEGDFSNEEVEMAIQKGFKPVSLGKSRLRTETAALVAVHTMNLLNAE